MRAGPTRLPLLCLATLAAWFIGMAALAAVIDPAAIVAFGDRTRLLEAIAAGDGTFLSAGSGFVTARPGGAGGVRRLYAAGAWFVWPVIGAGCRGLPRA